MDKLVVTPVEAAEMLQTRPSKIRELCDAGVLLHYKQGRNIKIPVEVLKRYVYEEAKYYTEVNVAGQSK